MLKRLCSLVLMLSLFVSCCGSALAAGGAEVQTSPTLSTYTTSLAAGSKGQVKVSYNVSSWSTASSIGVSSIKIYKSNGTYVTTINGNTSNGLLASNTNKKIGTYTYSGASGTYYYAMVTFTATVNGTSDWKTVTTNTAKAP